MQCHYIYVLNYIRDENIFGQFQQCVCVHLFLVNLLNQDEQLVQGFKAKIYKLFDDGHLNLFYVPYMIE